MRITTLPNLRRLPSLRLDDSLFAWGDYKPTTNGPFPYGMALPLTRPTRRHALNL